MAFEKLKQKFGKFRDDVIEPALETLGLKEMPKDPPELYAALDRASKVFEFSAAEGELPDELRLPRNLEIRDIVAEERSEIRSTLGQSANDILIPEMRKISERADRQSRWSEFFTPRIAEQRLAELRRQVLLPAYLDTDRISAVLNAPPNKDIKEQLEIRLGKKALEKEALKQNPVLRYAIFRLFRKNNDPSKPNDTLKFLNDAFGGKVKNLRPTEIEATTMKTELESFQRGEQIVGTSVSELIKLADEVSNYAAEKKKYENEVTKSEQELKDANNDLTKIAATSGLSEAQANAMIAVANARRNDAGQKLTENKQKLKELEDHKKAFLKHAKDAVRALQTMLNIKNDPKHPDPNDVDKYENFLKLADTADDENTFETAAKNISWLEQGWKVVAPILKEDIREREKKFKEKDEELEKSRKAALERPSTEQLLYLLIKQEIKNDPGAPKSEEALERQARLGWHLAIGEARESQYVLEANEVRAKALVRGKTPILKTITEKTKDLFTHEKPPPLEKHLDNLRRYPVNDKHPFEHFLLKPRYTRSDFMRAVEKDELELKHLQELYLLMGRFIENNRFKMDPEEIGKYQDYMQEARTSYVTLRQKELFEKYRRAPTDKKKDFYKEKMEEEQKEEEKLLEEVGPKVLKYLKHQYLAEEEKKERTRTKEEKGKIKDELEKSGVWSVFKKHRSAMIGPTLFFGLRKTIGGFFKMIRWGFRKIIH